MQQPQHETPESESSNFECYQNYTAPEVFVQHIAGIVNQGDVELIVRAQKQMLQRFEKTNEMLLNCIALSNGRLKVANDDFRKHIKLINDMKKDLDYIFKKIRNIKSRIGIQYPQAMKKVEQKLKTSSLSEESREEDSPNANDPQCSIDCKSSDKKSKSVKHVERKISKECVTVNYVQMETSTENTETGVYMNSNGKVETRAETVIAAGDGKTDNDSTDNESSDCTTDT
ncbi:kxDL motif-containing protein CG10681 [Sitodiplosis mosellana]|uniref:kxDL motif-containing protein CG10681 n=1 Tax=Sitodiplosis mosellana TaxID=263140 RepID=UPI002444DADE|nr:kxDL motif-containing protein CG10681 [Sitodiplosis mosellana]